MNPANGTGMNAGTGLGGAPVVSTTTKTVLVQPMGGSGMSSGMGAPMGTTYQQPMTSGMPMTSGVPMTSGMPMSSGTTYQQPMMSGAPMTSGMGTTGTTYLPGQSGMPMTSGMGTTVCPTGTTYLPGQSGMPMTSGMGTGMGTERPVATAAERREEQFLAKEEKLNDKLAIKEEKVASKFEKKAEKEHTKIEKLAQKGKSQSVIAHEAREAEYLAAAQVHHQAACDAQLHANSAHSLQADPNLVNKGSMGNTMGTQQSSIPPSF